MTTFLRPFATAEIGPVVVVPAHDIEHDAEAVYALSIDGATFTTDAWAFASPATSISRLTTTGSPALTPHTGTYMLTVGTPSPYASKAVRTVTGLTVGRSYTLRAWAGRSNQNKTARVGVTGVGVGSTVSGWVASTPEWKECVYTFTATATSHELYLEGLYSGGGTGVVSPDAWDDVTLTQDAWTEHVPDELETISVNVSGGNVVLDAGSVPYATATLDIPLVDPELIELVDPRDGVRVVLTAGDDYVGSAREFDLALRSRTADHEGKTIRLDLASDEALLMDYAPLTQDVGAFARQDSLRDVIDYVLDAVTPGAELAAGAADADVTVNYVRNPTAAENLDFWYHSTNSAAPVRIASGGPDGGPYVFLSQTGAGEWRGGQLLDDVPVVTGDVLEFEFDLRTHRDVDFVLEVQASGTWSGSGTIQKRGAGWSRHRGTITIAGGAVMDRLQFYAPSSSAGSWDIANVRLIHSTIERAPELLTWDPGVSGWDFLTAIAASVGLRLFCDEQRVWRLIEPAAYSVPGVIAVTVANATEGTDTVGRNDPTVYCTGVVARYRWKDSSGNQREQLDTAGVPGQVLVWDFPRPYPGPGAAAAMLARRVGAGRVQDVTALANWDATPGMAAHVSLPSTIAQVGALTSVSWTLTDGLMRVGTSGLRDTPVGAIDLAEGTIDAAVGTIDAYTGS